MSVPRLVTGLRRRVGLQRDANSRRRSVIDEIRSDARFREGLDKIVDESGRDRERVVADADGYLGEMVSVHSEAFPDFNLLLSRVAHRHSFEGVLQCDDAALEHLRIVNETSPLVMMTAHRSYLDFVVRVPFARRGFEREYRFAGANISFWPMGSIGRTVGIIFVRRGFRDPVYSFVLRQYVGWLAEHRASFLWAIEGGRTRTGKLLQPKAGLLAYLAQAYADGRAPDVTFVPTTVVYEFLNEVFEYARYGRGGSKHRESMVSFVSFGRQQRQVPPDARITVGLGTPVSLGDFVERGASDEQLSSGITLAAIEVCRRIDAATPITPVALVLLPLLERDGVSMTVDQIVAALEPTHHRIARRQLPTAAPGAHTTAGVERALELLRTQGLVEASGSDSGREYAVLPGRQIEAAYYRNSIVHYFAVRAIAEIAIVRCRSALGTGRIGVFWEEVDRLHDLLEREFFFPEGESFHDAIRAELAADAGDWEATLDAADGVGTLLEELKPFDAPRVLAPFLEAYRLVAHGLRQRGGQAISDEARLAAACLARGELDLRLGRIHRSDAVSLHMFDTPLAAAKASGLLSAGTEKLRIRLAESVDDALSAVTSLEATAGRAVVSELP